MTVVVEAVGKIKNATMVNTHIKELELFGNSAMKEKIEEPCVRGCITENACFNAGTLIETSEGLKAVETFVGGDWFGHDMR
ncbi:hypothetical protein OZX61_02230 [Acinetobacter sp. ESL0695]|uniref:hypothetical protein n=1 Tax=Acinetobacter sp. ESL0695 TaxID=2983215 RepID=UPI0023F54328|nr:hypothetical protein [Acinetobacter sp. ESL0695]WEV49327.1 hypothetical protein OZX61_02230 [Acinetobacter sp. ESL0695]